jgi:hypothetical protein
VLCGIAGAIPVMVALILAGALSLCGLLVVSTARPMRHLYYDKSVIRGLPGQVEKLGEALERHPFDPQAAGATPELLRLHHEARDAHRLAAQTSAKKHATRVEHAINRGYDALRDLELQWLGEPVTETWPSSDSSKPISTVQRPLGPLKMFHGTGNKLIRIPDDLPRRTVFELENRGPGKTDLTVRQRLIGRDMPTANVRNDKAARGLFDRRPAMKYRYIRIVSSTAWTLSFMDHTGVEQFETRAEGGSDDVLLYTGGPGIAKIVEGSDRYLRVSELDGDLKPRVLGRGDLPMFALTGPTLLKIHSRFPWSLAVRRATDGPLPLRGFSTAVEGAGCEVIRFTGRTSLVRLRTSDAVDFELRLLSPDLAQQTTLIKGRAYDGRIDDLDLLILLKEGSILQVHTADGKWLFQAAPAPKHGPGMQKVSKSST